MKFILEIEDSRFTTYLDGEAKASGALPIHKEWLSQHVLYWTGKRSFYDELEEGPLNDWLVWCVDQNYSYTREDILREEDWSEEQRLAGEALRDSSLRSSSTRRSKKVSAPATLSLEMLGLKKGG